MSRENKDTSQTWMFLNYDVRRKQHSFNIYRQPKHKTEHADPDLVY